ncbi:hypothetical protein KAU51_04785 [Candidatus Parcubacteria bacterium]|nr:hypothetical protein [Candidatus Parcubacteria bacterium]
MKNPKFTIGCDPEFFMRERATGKLISAIPFIKGTKHNPELLAQGGNIQRDNVAVEIATDPANTADQFVNNINCTLTEAVKKLPSGHEMIAIPSATFDKDQLEHPDACMFGCEPDYNAWSMCENDKPHAVDPTFRSCGAHIHVGTNGKDSNAFLLDFDRKMEFVKVMDCIHGVISTILDSSKEAIDRRQLYGKAGAHRSKDYGVEYRVLSNYWLQSPITVMMMYHLTQDALLICRERTAKDLIMAMGENEVQTVINKGQSEAAFKMLEINLLPTLSQDSIHYFNEALAKIKNDDMNFDMEWNLKMCEH